MKQSCKKSRAGSPCALEPRVFARGSTDHCFPILLNPLLLLFLVNHASDLSSQQISHFGYAKWPRDFIRGNGFGGNASE